MKLDAAEGKSTLDTNEIGAVLTYRLDGKFDRMAFQLYQSSGAWSAAVVTAQISFDGVIFDNFPDGAIAYGSVTAKPAMVVEDAVAVRLKATVANGAAGVLYVIATAGVDS